MGRTRGCWPLMAAEPDGVVMEAAEGGVANCTSRTRPAASRMRILKCLVEDCASVGSGLPLLCKNISGISAAQPVKPPLIRDSNPCSKRPGVRLQYRSQSRSEKLTTCRKLALECARKKKGDRSTLGRFHIIQPCGFWGRSS